MKYPQLNENGFNDYSYQGRVVGENLYQCISPPSPLNMWVQCFWQLDIPEGHYAYRSVPDNNVDCIFPLNNEEDSFVVAPFLAPAIFEMTGPVTYFGVRFRVLGQQWLTPTPVGEWGASNFKDIFGQSLLDRLSESIESENNFNDRCNKVGAILLEKMSYQAIDRRFERFLQYAYSNTSSSINLSDKQCAEFALSPRHLRRLCHLYLGLSPRNFIRVLRFQKTLHLMNSPVASAGWTDYYYDQPHFNREFKSLAGVTPREFMKVSALYNVSRYGR